MPHIVPGPDGHFTFTQIKSLSESNEVREYDAQGNVLWKITNHVFKVGPNWKDELSPRMASRKSNGNTVISAPNRGHLPSRIVEADASGRIVNTIEFDNSVQPNVVLPLSGGSIFMVDYGTSVPPFGPRVLVVGTGAVVPYSVHGLQTLTYAYPLGANAFLYGTTKTGVRRLVEIASYASGNPTVIWQRDIGLSHFFPLDENTILIANAAAHSIYVMDKTTGQTTWEYTSTSWPCFTTSVAASPCSPYLIYPASFTGYD